MSSRAIAIVILALFGGSAGLYLRLTDRGAPRSAVSTATRKYQCSMHPQIVSDQPGICPICQMKLTPVDDGPSAAPAGERRIVGYRHPMRSDVISPTPATDEMGMGYLPVYEDDTPPVAGTVPGHAGFTLSPERQQLIGVTRGRVERRPLAVAIRASGRVARDPMLYQAIIEYREAVKAKGEIKDSPWFEAHEGADAIVRAAALKLRQQGITPEQLAALGRAAGDPTNLLLPNSHVWIYAQVYEHELGLVRVGQPMVVTVPSLSGRTYDARIVAVDPVIDPMTRTARVRALVATPEAELRPETFVQVTIDVPLGLELAVPEEAVLDTGARQIVFVVTGKR
ncbi:MAG: efflux RND transporter periplasmic adaptor subunit [Candidatus Binatia bacterium]